MMRGSFGRLMVFSLLVCLPQTALAEKYLADPILELGTEVELESGAKTCCTISCTGTCGDGTSVESKPAEQCDSKEDKAKEKITDKAVDAMKRSCNGKQGLLSHTCEAPSCREVTSSLIFFDMEALEY